MIFRRLYPDDLSYVFSWLDEDDYLRERVLEFSASEGLAYGVEIDGRIEAVSILRPVGSLGWLMGARVRKDLRGRGVGGFMTRMLVEEARRRGLKAAALITSQKNTPVHRICDSIGMKRVLSLISGSLPVPLVSEMSEYEPLWRRVQDESEVVELARSIEKDYRLLPLIPDGWVWSFTEYVLKTNLYKAYACFSGEGRILALARPGCGWVSEDSCETYVGGVLLRGGGIDLEEGYLQLSCVADIARSRGVQEIIVWARDDLKVARVIESLGRWWWRSYLYYIDLE
ncbi:MAG: GNAT family N-acetyltransferase [Sulfolobales archaeon]